MTWTICHNNNDNYKYNVMKKGGTSNKVQSNLSAGHLPITMSYGNTYPTHDSDVDTPTKIFYKHLVH